MAGATCRRCVPGDLTSVLEDRRSPLPLDGKLKIGTKLKIGARLYSYSSAAFWKRRRIGKAYIAANGKPLPEGDTIGRTPDERLPVHYVPSPIDPDVKVWRVELN